jgi:hypothetical protein
MENEYPECEKMHKVSETSNQIGYFIDWLRGTKEIVFSKWYLNEDGDPEENDILLPEFPDMEKLLAEFFNIDLNKVEAERCVMLDEIRKANAQNRP